MLHFTAIAAFFSGLFLSAGLFLANAPFYFAPSATVTHAVYDTGNGLQLDLYTPKKAGTELRDTVVFFYGGGWRSGHKESYRFVGQTFAAKGYNVIIPDYRKYPAVRFPAFMEDGAKALVWAQDHAAEYHGAPNRVFLIGHSAGAHIGALLMADKHYLAAYKRTPQQTVRAFIGLSGPYDFTPDEPDYIAIFGPPARYPLMQVPNFITGKEPPMFLVYGDKDDTVAPYNLEKLAAKIKEKHGRMETKTYPGLDHIGTVSAITWLNPGHQPMLDDILNFLKK